MIEWTERICMSFCMFIFNFLPFFTDLRHMHISAAASGNPRFRTAGGSLFVFDDNGQVTTVAYLSFH